MHLRTLTRLHCSVKQRVQCNPAFIKEQILSVPLGNTDMLIVTNTEHYLVYTKHCYKFLIYLPYLILITTQLGRYFSWPRFAHGEADTSKAKNLTNITQLVSRRSGLQTPAVWRHNPHAMTDNLMSCLQRGVWWSPRIQITTFVPGTILISPIYLIFKKIVWKGRH
jgi:hypothetical protein